MRIISRGIVSRSKALFTGRDNGNHLCSSFVLCRRYSSNLDRVDESAKTELPAFVETRLQLWNQLKQKFDQQIESKSAQSINVRLSDGSTKTATAWTSTPNEIMNEINDKSGIVAKVNGVLWDLKRPLETDCAVEFVPFDDADGRGVFWHSSAQVLGAALEQLYGGLLCTGPPTENGFFHDIFTNGVAISSKDYQSIEKLIQQFVKERHPFERIEVSKADLMEMFQYNQFKLRMIEKKIVSDTATIYRCGNLIDMCHGPHVIHTGKLKHFKITKNSPAFWNGDSMAEKLERVYGISFETKDKLKEWTKVQEGAEKRDHRKIGREQDLFFFHKWSPGSCFFQPKGAHIYNTLMDFIKSEYRKRGYQEVITPNIFNSKLWKISGHWDHYAQNMFSFKTEKDEFVLKPMNCPGHCLIFANDMRSYRELPLRLADFGVLHRNEYSGGLTGLTRVRRFQQDDAHIFCTHDQIQDEIDGCLDFLAHVYQTFGFTFELVLSTRPDDFMGDLDTWNRAEKALEASLNKFGLPWKLNEGDGAFYGPKIDITITDALKRAHQCATIQLDFQLPERFELSYDTGDGSNKATPVIIHRAIFGSVERFIAIVTENFAGKWPFWLSPRQIAIVPVDPVFNEYAEGVQQRLNAAGFMVELDLDEHVKMNKKIRRAKLAQFNYILIVGERERSTNSVNVRRRDDKICGEVSVDDFIEKMNKVRDEKLVDEKVEF